MKEIRQNKMKFTDFSALIQSNFIHPLGVLYLPPSRAELMKAYQKGWDDRKEYEVANSRTLKMFPWSDYIVFPLNESPKLLSTHPDNDPKSIIHKPKKSWKAKK